MSKPLMKIVLPRLARRLHGQLERFRSGELSEEQFANRFASALQKQYVWLANQGVSETDAALTIHAAVLVLSRPGMKAAAEEMAEPFEQIEARAVRTAAADVAEHYDMEEKLAFDSLADIVAQYGE
jgi:hypothetical protein